MNSEKKVEKNDSLRSLRKAKGLSVEDVAGQLKLTTDAIRKLEKNDFKSLGAYTYVRGYMMHYSRLLGVDAEQYIDLIPKSDIEVPLVNTSSHLTKGIKLTRQSKNIASYALGTFIVLAVGFSGWFLLQNYTKPVKLDELQIVDNNQIEISPQQTVEIVANSEDNEIAEEESFHYSSLIPTSDDKGKINEEIAIPKQTSENNSENSNSTEEQVQPLAKEVSYHIMIEAKETSWVKVEHLDGTKLHNDLLNPGIITLESNIPVHFRIGNEKMVKVTINGESVDLSKFSRKRIADFNWPVDS